MGEVNQDKINRLRCAVVDEGLQTEHSRYVHVARLFLTATLYEHCAYTVHVSVLLTVRDDVRDSVRDAVRTMFITPYRIL